MYSVLRTRYAIPKKWDLDKAAQLSRIQEVNVVPIGSTIPPSEYRSFRTCTGTGQVPCRVATMYLLRSAVAYLGTLMRSMYFRTNR